MLEILIISCCVYFTSCKTWIGEYLLKEIDKNVLQLFIGRTFSRQCHCSQCSWTSTEKLKLNFLQLMRNRSLALARNKTEQDKTSTIPDWVNNSPILLYTNYFHCSGDVFTYFDLFLPCQVRKWRIWAKIVTLAQPSLACQFWYLLIFSALNVVTIANPHLCLSHCIYCSVKRFEGGKNLHK